MTKPVRNKFWSTQSDTILANKPLLLAMCVLVAGTILLFHYEYNREKEHAVDMVVSGFTERVATLNRNIAFSDSKAHLLRSWIEEQWKGPHANNAGADAIKAFVYRAKGDYFELIHPNDPVQDKSAGNIFGVGPVESRSPLIYRDLSHAMKILPQLKVLKNESTIINQLYFVTVSNICAFYPYLPASAIIDNTSPGGTLGQAFDVFHKFHEGYGAKSSREGYWTDIYLDRSGQGLMVTHASPVYSGNEFVGVLAIDITLSFLDRFTKTLAGPAGRIILTTNEGKVLVDTGMDADATFSEVKKLDDLLSNELLGAVQKLLNSDSFVTSSAGEYYLLVDRLQSAPWTVIHILDKGNLADYLSPTRITYGVVVIVMISLALLTNYAARRRKAEASLLKSERRYQEIVDYAAIGVYQVTAEGKFMMVNPELIRMFGYNGRDEFSSSVPNINSLYVDPKERPGLLRELDEKGFISGKEVRFRHKDGRTIWTRISTRSIKNSLGDTLYYEGFMADVTARRDAEAALLESSKKFRQFIEHAPVGFFTVDAAGQFTYANPVVLAMTGYSWEEWLNRPFSRAIYPDDLPIVMEKIQESRDGKKTQPPFEIRILTASGETMWVQVTSEAIYKQVDNGGEKLEQLQCFILDITEQRRAEEEKGRLQAQLLQSQKMEAIGTLAGGIAHDFNNILSAVLGYAELAQTETESSVTRDENLQQIINAGHRARGLVQQILQFSRQTSGEKIPVQVSPLVKEALKLLRASLPATIDIRSELRCDAAIMADPTQLHQVVMNLCTNAAHSMEQSGGILTLGLTEEYIDANWDPELLGLKIGRYMKLTVADTGQGIDLGVQKRIFDPFFTTKELGHGTGMGLAVVHGIVQECGGTVKVRSEPGNGAVFDVYLPITEMEALPAGQADTPLMTGSETILLVDDEQIQTDLGQRMLSRLGYKVITRNSSTDALALFQHDPGRFDLVITDMTMPNMTGDLLATKLLETRPDIPIILCTGFSERVTEQQARALGVREFAMKPLVIRELAKIVRKVLDEDE